MYSLCRDTVTVYRCMPEGIRRQVYTHANLQMLDKLVEDTHSPEWERPFLLILPGNADICVGDRVIRGEGPEVTGQTWAEFIPENVEGLCVAQYVQQRHLNGSCCHTEAGRKASAFLY